MSILLALILCDFILRIKNRAYYVFSDDSVYYHRIPKQHYQGMFRDVPKYPFSYPRSLQDGPERPFSFTVDAHGFRNRLAASERYSWVAVGDSFTEGSLVSDEEMWVDRLSQVFEQPLYNCGISGSSPLHYRAFLKNHGINLQSDGVLFVLYEGNDFRDCNYRREKKGKAPWYTAPSRYLSSSPLRKQLKQLSLKTLAKANSRRFAADAELDDPKHPMYPVAWLPLTVNEEKGNNFAFDVKSLEEHLRDESSVEGSKGYQETLKMIKECQLLCQQKNKKMLLLYVPDLPHVIMPTICSKVDERQLDAFLATRKISPPENLKEKLLQNCETKEKLIEEFCQREAIDFLSLTAVLREKTSAGIQTYYCYDQHWTAEGHQVVADFLADKLGKIIPEE